MSKKFFILLEEFSKKPTAEIGQLCKSISNLTTIGIPTPKAICVPPNTLRVITKANNLEIKIYKLIQETDFNSSISINKTTSKLKKLINKQIIPGNLSKEFLEIYHNYFRSSFVMVQNSNSTNSQNLQIQNIKEDTNAIDAFFEVWANSAAQTFKQLATKTNSLDKVLYSNTVLIKQQIDSKISGIGYTFDKNDGNKKRFTIEAIWGILNNNLKEADNYLVDSRTFILIEKNTKTQTVEFNRNLESLKRQKLSDTKKNKNKLTGNQTQELAKIISKISRSSLFPLEISWGLQNGVFFVDEINETDYTTGNLNKTKKTIKKLYVSVTKNQDIKTIADHADGLCILNSGKLLSLLGEHPMRVAKFSQKKLLVEAIAKTISGYSDSLHIIYRSQNLTSKEFSKLKYSKNYEEKEDNPLLGLRGASRIIGQPQMFGIELEIVKKLMQKNRISLLIPFARSSDEISQVIKMINKKTKNTDIWLELSTPENVLNFSSYPINKISSFVFNLGSIYKLILGIDSIDNNTLSKYPVNTDLILELIKNVSKKLKINQKLLVDLTDFSSGVIKEIVHENIDGIIVNPKVTDVAKKCIINEEEKQILYGKN